MLKPDACGSGHAFDVYLHRGWEHTSTWNTSCFSRASGVKGAVEVVVEVVVRAADVGATTWMRALQVVWLGMTWTPLCVYAAKPSVYLDSAEDPNGEALGRGVWEGGITCSRSSVAGALYLCDRSISARDAVSVACPLFRACLTLG